MLNLKLNLILLVTSYSLVVAGLWGCATVIESAKGISGISTKVLEDGRKNAIKKTFNYHYNDCYNKTKEILRRINVYIYAEDQKKQLIAIYVSEIDTTPVGIFLNVIDTGNTSIEVSSPSTYAKEFISTKLFTILEKSLKPDEEKGKSDAQ